MLWRKGTVDKRRQTIDDRRLLATVHRLSSVVHRPTVDIGTLITRSPEIRAGRPRIAGTGVTVERVVGWYKLGLGPEEIASRIGHLTLAQVHAALTYYYANQEEIEAALEAEEAEADSLANTHRATEANR